MQKEKKVNRLAKIFRVFESHLNMQSHVLHLLSEQHQVSLKKLSSLQQSYLKGVDLANQARSSIYRQGIDIYERLAEEFKTSWLKEMRANKLLEAKIKKQKDIVFALNKKLEKIKDRKNIYQKDINKEKSEKMHQEVQERIPLYKEI